jgi:hypothetical protein
MLEFTQPIATILAAIFGGTLGAWIGAVLALGRFQRERAFDRRLDWYERMLRGLHNLALKLDVALYYQKAVTERDPSSLRPQTDSGRVKAWCDVQEANIDLTRLRDEGYLYGSSEAVAKAEQAIAEVYSVGRRTDGFDSEGVTGDLSGCDNLRHLVRAHAKEFAVEGRRLLRLRETANQSSLRISAETTHPQ